MNIFSGLRIFKKKNIFFSPIFLLKLDFMPLDLHVFADPNPGNTGSQNVADPTDPDPKHCFIHLSYFSYLFILFNYLSSSYKH